MLGEQDSAIHADSRIGQEPPPEPQEAPEDGRTLFEV